MSAWHHYFVSWNTDNVTSYFPANPAFFSCIFRDFPEQPKYLLTVVQNKITNSMWWFGMESCHDKSCFCWWYVIYTRHNINHINHSYASECIWLHASARLYKTTHCFASAVEHWCHTLTVYHRFRTPRLHMERNWTAVSEADHKNGPTKYATKLAGELEKNSTGRNIAHHHVNEISCTLCHQCHCWRMKK